MKIVKYSDKKGYSHLWVEFSIREWILFVLVGALITAFLFGFSIFIIYMYLATAVTGVWMAAVFISMIWAWNKLRKGQKIGVKE